MTQERCDVGGACMMLMSGATDADDRDDAGVPITQNGETITCAKAILNHTRFTIAMVTVFVLSSFSLVSES